MSGFSVGDRVQVVSSHPTWGGKRPFGRVKSERFGFTGHWVVALDDGRSVGIHGSNLIRALEPKVSPVPGIPVQRDLTHNEDDARGVTPIAAGVVPLVADPPAAPLSAGANLVVGDRLKDYGHPTRNFHRIAALWSAILSTEVTPQDVALMMMAMKISREKSAHKPDNLDDIEGYVYCLRLLVSEGTTSAEETGTDNKVTHEV